MKRSVILAAVILTGCASVQPAAQPEPMDETPVPAVVQQTTTTGETTEEIKTETSLTERTAVSTEEIILPDYTRVSDETGDVFTDIQLWSDENELLTSEDPEIIWYAEIPVKCWPEIVGLIDADTGEVAATLNDIADYEKYGGDIMGDGVYNCRFTVDTDINTDDDVSEQRTYRYYAEFADETGIHRSEIKEIAVYEPFTEKELGDMEAVDEAIRELMEDEDFLSLDVESRSEKMLELLHRLAAEGTPERPYPLIIEDSIVCSGDQNEMISYEHICGIPSGIGLVPLSSYSTEPGLMYN